MSKNDVQFIKEIRKLVKANIISSAEARVTLSQLTNIKLTDVQGLFPIKGAK